MPSVQSDQIRRAIGFYNNRTNIRWVPRTSESNHVEFVYSGSGGCSSYVGMIGGRQTINFSNWCGVAGAMHEMGHAIGFHHEQSRSDRDDFIRIDCSFNNCNDINWRIMSEARPYRRYDYYSIMHYGAFWGSRQVIFPLDPNVDPLRVGASSRLTAKDISAVNFLYP
jgi:astacin